MEHFFDGSYCFVIAFVFVVVNTDAEDLAAREEVGLAAVDELADFEFGAVVVGLVLLLEVHHVVELVFPVVVVVGVLVEGDALLLERVAAEPADEAGVVDVRLERVVDLVELAEGVDDDAEDDVEHHDHDDDDVQDVVEQARLVLGVLNADGHEVVAAPADAVVHVEDQAGRDRVAEVERPPGLVRVVEHLLLLEPDERDQREHLHDDHREDQREHQHFPVLGDRVHDVLQVFVPGHDVLDVEDEEHLRDQRPEQGHENVQQPLVEHLVPDQGLEVVDLLHHSDRH